ncbi:MAG: hypothetical protein JXP73_07245 [Deltaproteobacteria bacterium]|jgi:hypothetical protein|nr:hypothetical protein [Deltaproteobacteria bacterium]
MRSYACTAACGWSGLVPSLSGLERRQRQVRTTLVIVVLGLAAGLAVWKYGADLAWSPEPPADDGLEELSSE